MKRRRYLAYVPSVYNASVCDDRDVEKRRVPRHIVYGAGLRPADGANLLRRADGTNAHPHTKAVNAAVNEVLRLQTRHYIAADDIEFGKFFLDVCHHLILSR